MSLSFHYNRRCPHQTCKVLECEELCLPLGRHHPTLQRGLRQRSQACLVFFASQGSVLRFGLVRLETSLKENESAELWLFNALRSMDAIDSGALVYAGVLEILHPFRASGLPNALPICLGVTFGAGELGRCGALGVIPRLEIEIMMLDHVRR